LDENAKDDKMTSLSRRLIIIIAVGVAVLFIVLVMMGLRFINLSGENKAVLQDMPITEATPGGIAEEPPYTPVAKSAPGWVVYGFVRDKSGTGMEGVSIYRSYASYAGVEIATTDINGYYQSDFYAIPGDEMVTVWADRSDLEFTPENYHWRHYYGYEQVECDFLLNLP
jgi:hypothetical protein